MSDINASRLGAQIRAHRAAAGLTLGELAEASAISVRAISNVERGISRNPHRHTIGALARGLALSGDDRAELARIASPSSHRPDDLVIGGVCPTATAPVLHESCPGTRSDSGCAVKYARLGAGHRRVRATWIGKDRPSRAGRRVVGRAIPGRPVFVDRAGIDSAPMSAEDALDRLLRAIGTPLGQISNRLDERAGQWRAATADRRLLVVLDNAADEAQVRPLLPGAGETLVLVTSRHTLGGLEGVTRIVLEPMTQAESVALLRAITDSPF